MKYVVVKLLIMEKCFKMKILREIAGFMEEFIFLNFAERSDDCIWVKLINMKLLGQVFYDVEPSSRVFCFKTISFSSERMIVNLMESITSRTTFMFEFFF